MVQSQEFRAEQYMTVAVRYMVRSSGHYGIRAGRFGTWSGVQDKRDGTVNGQDFRTVRYMGGPVWYMAKV